MVAFLLTTLSSDKTCFNRSSSAPRFKSSCLFSSPIKVANKKCSKFQSGYPVYISGESREGIWGARPPPLFFDQNEARRVEKNFFRYWAPPYLKVWICHCTSTFFIVSLSDFAFLMEGSGTGYHLA